jgi:hypothetical protein
LARSKKRNRKIMSNKKQTAVQWFFSELERMQYFGNDMLQAYNQAKEMEKQEIINTWYNGYLNQSPMIDEENSGEQYYKETFKSE